MDFNIWWGDNLATKVYFFGGQGVGQTEKRADVVSVNDVIEDKNEGVPLNLALDFF